MKPVHASQRPAVVWCVAFSLLAGFTSFSHGADSSWTEVKRVPHFVGMNMDAGVYMLARGRSLVGYGVQSHAERWSVKIKNTTLYPCSGHTSLPRKTRRYAGSDADGYRRGSLVLPKSKLWCAQLHGVYRQHRLAAIDVCA